MKNPSPQRLYDAVIGACPEANPWWDEWNNPSYDGIVWRPEEAPDDWCVTGRVWSPDAPEGERTIPFRINYPSLLGALHVIDERDAHRDDIMECVRTALAGDDADFDAESSDVVCQVAVFGKSRFS